MSNEKLWFKVKAGEQVYYSDVSENEDGVKFAVVGNGISAPTPDDRLAFIHAHKKDPKIESFHLLPETGGSISRVYHKSDLDKTKVILPGGTYIFKPSQFETPPRLLVTEHRTDTHIELAEQYIPIVDAVKEFLDNESIYRTLNIIYKRGFLLYGPPGTGKSSGIRSLITKHLPSDAVTITLDTMIDDEFLLFIKKTLANRLKVFIFEELTNVCNNPNLVEETLNFLDGENSLDNTVIFATTNYPERLEANIVDRPSRFDAIFKIDVPNAQERQMLMNFFLQREATEEEVNCCKEMTTAQIKEVCIYSLIKKCTITVYAARMKKHSQLVQKEFAENKGKMGF